ncbi:protein PFC0760c-like [Odontomachus brunneus]|uniref:protein PFC0760c-like n=1 Tax=Odontomachus brunneus TaxID=486640 RepID=UPI0013F2A451|nr:protein PFC0760c-like [Odontomachus brunneus]XP_032670175.1 protein PFC0760c-like [Odontomachus brunneus]
MRLSTIFELLLILLLVAFAAYGRVIDRDEVAHRVIRAADNSKQSDMSLSTMSLKQATDSVNRYCTCNENICNCCRDFHIPVVQLKGPGCASLQYLQGDNLAMQLSFGDNILTSTMVNGKSPRPVCVPLPGGFTKFCGRIYSIQRDAKNHFKACLGLELQSATELEASLRVSCFRFGPDGLKLRPAEPLPVVEAESTEEDEDDDFFGFGSDDDEDDDDEDDEDDRPSLNSVPDASGIDDAQDADDEDDDDDLLGLGTLLDIFTGDDDATTKRPRPTTVAPLLQFTIPILTRPTTPAPLEDYELSTSGNNVSVEPNNDENSTQEPVKLDEEEETESVDNNNEDIIEENQEEEVTEASNKIVFYAKPDKGEQPPNKVKKGVVGDKKKPTVTSTSINAIDEPEKPSKKPIKDEDENEDDDDDDEDAILDDDDEDDDEVLDDDYDKDDEDEDEDDEDKLDDEKFDDDEDEKAEDFDDLDDEDDEEDEAMLTAIMGTGKNKKNNKGDTINKPNVDEDDYGLGLGFLARKRHPEGNRQSKITRL